MDPVTLEEFTDPVDGTRWQVDIAFMASSWRCRFGDGCQGILDERSPELSQGCCSVGVELIDDEEAMLIAALGASLDPALFQNADAAADGGVLREDLLHTRLVDGACIFLNRPGFSGGAGCALHLGALADGERPMDNKPSVCWQLPLRIDGEDGGSTATLRGWTRTDWGSDGETMAWCCTERQDDDTDCYDGDSPVIDTLGDEVRALVGPDVAVANRARVRERDEAKDS